MSLGFPTDEIEKEWQTLSKDWYSIYQWQRTSGVGYTEPVTQRIESMFDSITLITDGLRDRSFRVKAHRGQIKLNTGIEQLTEKRLVRAMFNASTIPLLGKVIDYETPLKDNDEARHGDIDLVCVSSDQCFCVEAKKPKASESILKAVLQAFVYTSLASKKKSLFLKSFGLDQRLKLTPAILTFTSAQSGRQLNVIDKYPMLQKLIQKIDSFLETNEINPIRFFLITNSDHDLKPASPQPQVGKMVM